LSIRNLSTQFDKLVQKTLVCRRMTATAKKLEQEIRQLPLEDMLALHESLTASIHEREDGKPLDPAFREEIQKRIEEIDSGKAEGVDPFQTLKGM
jgi:hypothetical protein